MWLLKITELLYLFIYCVSYIAINKKQISFKPIITKFRNYKSYFTFFQDVEMYANKTDAIDVLPIKQILVKTCCFWL